MTNRTQPKLATTKEAGLIEMQQVVKTFSNAAGEFTALRGIDLTLNRGEFVAIIGKSGSGKSTLLNMLTGIDHPTTGKVIVEGVDVYAMSESKRSLWRGRNLGIVFQFFQLLPMLNLLENVMLPMDYVGMYDVDERPKRAMELLRMVGLEEHAQKLPRAVSTGQQQSAAIARALSTDAPIIVADEPTGNLDSRSANHIIDLFAELSERGKTIVMVTHDASMTKRTSRTVVISDGELVNETIAQSLPLLSQPLMKALSNKVEKLSFHPGETIIHSKEPVENFFMIAKGNVDVVLHKRRKDEVVIAQLSVNDFFGEMELLRGGKSVANVRAAEDTPVELLALSRDDFNWLLKESPLTEKAIGHIVQKRLGEQKQADRRKRRRLFG
ncbi:MAG: ATP-binding cassette domain-containing protein [Anaerolineae bacterium]|jgi:ABC-type lipoprotein export system ATPase subunit|nr:ATP-binding cassette domain-containing protein [Anaerolineae bacterium]MBT4309685.1 ATP-binding cassette domain-containing protein [Anaerolineae bacterium]MBT4459421.1 ATP-binding cassette domain-containing protein [Anaerolineae bacterium]MBT4842021.1 ATP-binding cassette domain-containing protein [Anaerolineae bacterium]MBT6061658.1 ATP-binding cassette domain-containing protein [Anaerolineae bacterium]